MASGLPFQKQIQQFDALINSKPEYSSQSMRIGWRKRLNSFAFLFLKLNKTSILFTFLLKIVSNLLYRKSCLYYKRGSKQTKIDLGIRVIRTTG